MPCEVKTRSGRMVLLRDGKGRDKPMRQVAAEWVRFENLDLADLRHDRELDIRPCEREPAKVSAPKLAPPPPPPPPPPAPKAKAQPKGEPKK